MITSVRAYIYTRRDSILEPGGQGSHSTADPNLKSVSSIASNNLDQYYLASKETSPILTSRGHYQLYHHGTMDLDVGGDRGDMLTTRYIGYPATKPFINTDFEREDRPVNSYPTTNRDDVISALKSLQNKMHKLEIDRRISEQALLTLTSDTEKFKEHLNIGGQSSGGGGVGRSYKLPADPQTEDEIADKHAQELRDQLLDTENRCQMLGKQLENMKSMTLTSHRTGWDFKEKTYRSGPDGELKYHIDRLNELERDQARLTTTQSLAERKIQELETKLQEEKRHRKVLQEKTTQLETATVSNVKVTRNSTQPLPRPHSSPAQLPKTKKVIKKKNKKAFSSRSAPVKLEPTRHFRLNLAEVPFVAGKSTGPSHSLVANVQKVLSMMKTHNPALCSMYANADNQLTDSSPSSGSSSASIDQDLNDLIKQLQDEYGQLASESHRLLDEIHTMRDLHAREELEKEYEAVVAKMKSKRDQISKIMKHQQKLSKVAKEHSTGVKQTERLKRPHSHPCRPISSLTKHFHSQKNRPVGSQPPAACSKIKASNSAPVNPALYMLRDMKKLQTTLRRDDLSWD